MFSWAWHPASNGDKRRVNDSQTSSFAPNDAQKERRTLEALQNLVSHVPALVLFVRGLHGLAEGGVPCCLPTCFSLLKFVLAGLRHARHN